MVDTASQSFDLLHEKVRRWIWMQGWEELRDIQERSIPLLMGADRDLIIGAGTASGKTEAAFFPIISRIAYDAEEPGSGFQAIYLSPLRALINDQFGRLESLCEEIGIEVTKWHGDVSASVKQRARRRPSGVLLTTPESLEAILVRRGPEAARLFGALRYAVIDEMHAFLDAPRGRQLQSLLHRVEKAVGRRVSRVGLSATLADMSVAKAFLRPEDPTSPETLVSPMGGQELRLQLRGYTEPAKAVDAGRRGGDGDEEEGLPASQAAITRHIFDTLRGGRSLIFAGSRQRVELFAVGLGELTEAAGVPDEFFAHHGSLSREHREEAERRMKDPSRPASIVCTTTLEMGIDVGEIAAVAQYGAGHTVSGLRQRLGRSGRRAGQPAVMRVYLTEPELTERTHPLDALRQETFQAIAMLNLMLRRWNEPPVPGRLHLSTMVHQVLALIGQHGGLTAQQGWARLVDSKVFSGVDLEIFKAVLRRMAHPDVRLLEQAPDGTLLPGAEGERVLAGRDFYAVFQTPEEFQVVSDRGKVIGTLPMVNPILPQQLIVFGGRRWRVREIDNARRTILVERARGGRPPAFGGDWGLPHEGVIAEMRRLYASDEVPPYLDAGAQAFMSEGRATFQRLRLEERSIVPWGDQVLIFPWTGSRGLNTLLLTMMQAEMEPVTLGIALAVPAEMEERLRQRLRELVEGPPPEPLELARLVPEKQSDKFDVFLDDELLSLAYAREKLDCVQVGALAEALLREAEEGAP